MLRRAAGKLGPGLTLPAKPRIVFRLYRLAAVEARAGRIFPQSLNP